MEHTDAMVGMGHRGFGGLEIEMLVLAFIVLVMETLKIMLPFNN